MVGFYSNSIGVAFRILPLQAELRSAWTAGGGCPYATLDGAEPRHHTSSSHMGIQNELHYYLRVRIASGPVPDLLKEGHHVIE